jgi:hypothetical protein
MIDFDYMMKLHQEDPKRFEHERTKLTNDLISKCTPRNKLKLTALQAKINRVIRTSRTPLNACAVISEMMWDSFEELKDRLKELSIEHKRTN